MIMSYESMFFMWRKCVYPHPALQLERLQRNCRAINRTLWCINADSDMVMVIMVMVMVMVDLQLTLRILQTQVWLRRGKTHNNT